MVVTIPLAFVEPSSGEFRDPPLIPLFYTTIAGIIIILVYNSYKEKKKDKKLMLTEDQKTELKF